MASQTVEPPSYPRMLRVGEAAKILHVHPNTLRKWSSTGVVPSYRIGSRRDRRFTLEDLTGLLRNGYQV